METQNKQQTITTAQVTGLLNYWQKIIDYLWQAVETTIADLAVTKHLSEKRRIALKSAIDVIESNNLAAEELSNWKDLLMDPNETQTEPTMADLANPKEEVIQ